MSRTVSSRFTSHASVCSMIAIVALTGGCSSGRSARSSASPLAAVVNPPTDLSVRQNGTSAVASWAAPATSSAMPTGYVFYLDSKPPISLRAGTLSQPLSGVTDGHDHVVQVVAITATDRSVPAVTTIHFMPPATQVAHVASHSGSDGRSVSILGSVGALTAPSVATVPAAQAPVAAAGPVQTLQQPTPAAATVGRPSNGNGSGVNPAPAPAALTTATQNSGTATAPTISPTAVAPTSAAAPVVSVLVGALTVVEAVNVGDPAENPKTCLNLSDVQMVLSDNSGKTLAVAAPGPGTTSDATTDTGAFIATCSYSYTLTNVPAESIYKLTVAGDISSWKFSAFDPVQGRFLPAASVAGGHIPVVVGSISIGVG